MRWTQTSLTMVAVLCTLLSITSMRSSWSATRQLCKASVAEVPRWAVLAAAAGARANTRGSGVDSRGAEAVGDIRVSNAGEALDEAGGELDVER